MAYCTISDLERVLSADGVALRLDDVPPDNTDAEDAIEEAGTEIEAACLMFYTQTRLESSNWVKHKAKDLAAYLLCIRRGNPAPESVAAKYERAMAVLERVRMGSYLIPGLPMTKAAAPTMSNMRPTLRPHPRSVVEKARSTGKPEGYRQTNLDPLDRTNQDMNRQV